MPLAGMACGVRGACGRGNLRAGKRYLPRPTPPTMIDFILAVLVLFVGTCTLAVVDEMLLGITDSWNLHVGHDPLALLNGRFQPTPSDGSASAANTPRSVRPHGDTATVLWNRQMPSSSAYSENVPATGIRFGFT